MEKKKKKREQDVIPEKDNSYRVIWELDVDAPDATQAAKQAYDSILNGIMPVFEVHQWVEPDMVELVPVAHVNVGNTEEELSVPEPRMIHEEYMGPDIV